MSKPVVQRIVQKFGGTSVGDIARIQNVAQRVIKEVQAGHQVVVVVSAMAGVTNQLVAYAQEVSQLDTPEKLADYDHIVASGEQVTSGLLALVLQELGVKARAFTGAQLALHTDNAYSRARITAIDTEALEACLATGKVAVVAGFQGMSGDGRIATLGRGGSDTSAVAIAAAIAADRCDIYTDVDGVYSCDPRIVKNARKLHQIAFEEMLEMASQGAKVLQTRSVEMAMNHGVCVQVRSSFEDIEGTYLVSEDQLVEQQQVTGLAYNRDEARITIIGVQDKPGVSAAIFGSLAKANINVDMIVQNVTPDGATTDVTFTVPAGDLAAATRVLEALKPQVGYQRMHTDANVAKISIIGVGMRSHTGVAQKMFETLADKNINIMVISTSEIKVSVLIEESYTELALRSLHTAFGLDAGDCVA